MSLSRGGEMVDTPVLGTGPARDGGSSPLLGTSSNLFGIIGIDRM